MNLPRFTPRVLYRKGKRMKAMLYVVVRVELGESGTWVPVRGEQMTLGPSVTDALSTERAQSDQNYGVWSVVNDSNSYVRAEEKVRTQSPDFVAKLARSGGACRPEDVA